MKLLKYSVISLGLAIALTGCGSDSDGGNSTTGKFSLGVSDAPIDDVSSVTAVYNRAVLLPQDGSDPIELDFTTGDIDENGNVSVELLDYQGASIAPLVTDVEVPAGDYKLCLFVLDGVEQDERYSHVIEGELETGPHYPLQVQGDGACPQGVGKEDGAGVLYFNKTFSVNNGNNDFVAEFDLRRGLKAPVGNKDYYTIQRTSVQLINEVESGHISGTVDVNLVSTCAGGNPDDAVSAVYVYSGTVALENMKGFNDEFVDNQVAPTTSANVSSIKILTPTPMRLGSLEQGSIP